MNQNQERLLILLSYAPADHEPGSADAISDHAAWNEQEWAAIVAEARRHTLGPLLYHKLLTRFPNTAIPAQVIGKLRSEYLHNAVTNMRRFQLFAPVLKALKTSGVPTIVLKGAYLAKAVYDNITLRSMHDMDILVQREDLAKANAALSSAGFIPQEFHLSPPDDINEFHYQEAVSKAIIEVHWELIPPDYPFKVDIGSLWEAAVPARIDGVDILTFSPEDLLIHLGLHATIHRFVHGLRPLCDMAEVVSHLHVNWHLVEDKIKKNGVGRAVRVPLLLAAKLLKAAIPEDEIRRIQTTSLPNPLWEEARETILLNSPVRSTRKAPNPNLVLLWGRKRWRDKLALLLRRVFPSRKMIAALYPVPMHSLRVFLYYPVLFLALLKRNVTGFRIFLSGTARRSSTHKKAAALMDWLLTRE